MTVTTKVTGKGQITLPSEIRKALHIEPGDTVAFELLSSGEGAFIRRAALVDFEYMDALTSSLPEWSSEEDDKLFRNL